MDDQPITDQQAAAIPIVDPEELNKDLPEGYAEQKAKEEEGADTGQVGGVGSNYRINISSWRAFRAAIMGHGYDIDNMYGWQCWDGAALLWQQLGLALLTGNGLAIGCWDLKRNVDKYNKFDLVTDVNHLSPGDVVVMRPNHIGFFNGYAGNYMIIDAENQGGARGPNGGMAFNEVRIPKSAFAGAFRLRAWHAAPKPAPKPAHKSNDAIAHEVIQGKWGNGADRKARLTKAGYNYNVIQAIVNRLV